jgi:phosphate starvation-inducible PhoH-like protein
LNPKKDSSPYVFQSKKRDASFVKLTEKIPFTDKQLEFIRLAQDKGTKVLFVSGPAGTSKTLLSVYVCLNFLKQKKVSDIIYVRSAVESASVRLGYLPGELEEKFSPYLSPLVDKLEELVGPQTSERLVKESFVLGKPINYLRGCHFAGRGIIFDEAQNFTKQELTTGITRMGEFSKVLVCGDPMQSDIGDRSAFQQFFNAFNNRPARSKGIFTFKFTEEDIVRAEILKFIVKTIQGI